MSEQRNLLQQLPGGCNGWWEFRELSTRQQDQARALWPAHAGERRCEDYKYAVADFDGEVRARQLKEHLR